MNGAESLVRTLIDSGIEVCFSNPGTSEMHFVAALDKVAGMRCVLGLFEGVVTGAADGYYRMTDKPAATLLHLGPGLGNGLANLHNARKAESGIVNIVGDHATYHIEYDAPLTADIEGIAGPVSGWVKTSDAAIDVAADGAAAVAAANTYPGQVATLILPANTAWEPSNGPAAPLTAPPPAAVPQQRIDEIAQILQSGEPTAFVLTGHTLREQALLSAGKIAAATGAKLLAQSSNARLERGVGRVAIESIPYVVDRALAKLAGYKHLIPVCAKAPVAFFAYPDKPSQLWPQDCQIHTLASPNEDGAAALEALADRLSAKDASPLIQQPASLPMPSPNEPINATTLAAVLANLIPENAIIVDEGITNSRDLPRATAGCPPHDWLQICGGSIGIGFPLATGAAIACPQRKVIGVQADGSGMYTLQALWTQARENLDITTILLSNRSYEILKHELRNVGANAGQIAIDMMDLDRPNLDWLAMAKGMGVDGSRACNVAELATAIQTGLASQGPYLVEAIL